jgi:hypothetical protein
MPTIHQEWIAPIAGILGALVGGGVAILNNYISFCRVPLKNGLSLSANTNRENLAPLSWH